MQGSSHTGLSIAIAVPIRPGTNSGNSVTASRWADQLATLGHSVEIVSVVEGADRDVVAPSADLVIALHARRCARAITVAKNERPERPLIVALTGTDLYLDLPKDPSARRSVEQADALVVLQEDGLDHLDTMDPSWRAKAHVIHQSVQPSGLEHRPASDRFTVVVLAFLRDVKDPLLAATAARLLPATSSVQVVHAGSAHTPEWHARAEVELQENPRYRWVGELDPHATAELLATAHVLACTSHVEGGANVVSEALAQGVAVVGTDIGGNRGLLGTDHPGLVPVGDAASLCELIASLEQNPVELETLTQHSVDRQWMTEPAHEQAQWAKLIGTQMDSVR